MLGVFPPSKAIFRRFAVFIVDVIMRCRTPLFVGFLDISAKGTAELRNADGSGNENRKGDKMRVGVYLPTSRDEDSIV